MIFVRDTRSKVTQEFPEMNALDVMKEVGRRWQSITKENKDYFQSLADKDKERFKKENQIYLKDLDALDKKLKSSNNTKINMIGDQENDQDQTPAYGINAEEDPKNSHPEAPKKGKRGHNAPKKQLSGYIYFSQEEREKLKIENPKMTTNQIMKEISNRWAAMSEEEKAPFMEAAKGDQKRYDDEVAYSKNKSSEDVQIDNNIQGNPKYQDFYEVESNSAEVKNRRKRNRQSEDDSWSADHKALKRKAGNKMATGIPPSQKQTQAKESPKHMQIEEPISVDEPKFVFKDPMIQSSKDIFKQFNPPQGMKDSKSFVTNNANMYDNTSGNTDINQQSTNFIPRLNMFSPTPFAPNRSPGVSPNMMGKFAIHIFKLLFLQFVLNLWFRETKDL